MDASIEIQGLEVCCIKFL